MQIFVLLWVAAFLLIISVGLSDFCADEAGGPDAVILRLVENGTSDGDFVQFRLTCEGTNDLLDNDLVDLNKTAVRFLASPNPKHLRRTHTLGWTSRRCWCYLRPSALRVTTSRPCTKNRSTSCRRLCAPSTMLCCCTKRSLLARYCSGLHTCVDAIRLQTFNELYVTTVHVALCDDLLTGFILLWIGGLMLSLFMGCIVCVAGRRALGVQKE